jgi:hypothetical protein
LNAGINRLFAGNSLTGILGFLLFAAMGLGMLGYMTFSAWHSHASLSWPVAEGRVVSAEVVTHTAGANSRNSSYVPKVGYEYTAAGRRYTDERLAFGFGNRSPEAAQRLARRFKALRRVRVYYDPAEPDRSVLMPGSTARSGWAG